MHEVKQSSNYLLKYFYRLTIAVSRINFLGYYPCTNIIFRLDYLSSHDSEWSIYYGSQKIFQKRHTKINNNVNGDAVDSKLRYQWQLCWASIPRLDNVIKSSKQLNSMTLKYANAMFLKSLKLWCLWDYQVLWPTTIAWSSTCRYAICMKKIRFLWVNI